MLTIPNDVGIYDNANYLHYPIINITGKKFVKLKPEFSAGLLMIKWSPIGRVPLANQPDSDRGIIRLTALAGVGKLPPVDFEIEIDRLKTAQFITPGFNGLSYSIELQQKLPVTQLKISEYLYPVSYLNNQQNYQMAPSPGYPSGESRSNGTTQNPVVTIAASLTSVELLPANPLRAPDSTIRNYSNRILYVSFSETVPPTVSTDFDFAPAASGNQPGTLDIPADYEGRILGIWAGPSPTANAKITQFSYN
jgi:hypothetical protein